MAITGFLWGFFFLFFFKGWIENFKEKLVKNHIKDRSFVCFMSTCCWGDSGEAWRTWTHPPLRSHWRSRLHHDQAANSHVYWKLRRDKKKRKKKKNFKLRRLCVTDCDLQHLWQQQLPHKLLFWLLSRRWCCLISIQRRRTDIDLWLTIKETDYTWIIQYNTTRILTGYYIQ